jgi:hypothetical protein
LISFSLTLSCLLKDQAMAASRHDATLKHGAPSYTTSVDSTASGQPCISTRRKITKKLLDSNYVATDSLTPTWA